jgi:hypothetical protein
LGQILEFLPNPNLSNKLFVEFSYSWLVEELHQSIHTFAFRILKILRPLRKDSKVSKQFLVISIQKNPSGRIWTSKMLNSRESINCLIQNFKNTFCPLTLQEELLALLHQEGIAGKDVKDSQMVMF